MLTRIARPLLRVPRAIAPTRFVRAFGAFEDASAAVQKLPSMSNEDKLKLYALYKQATAGPNTTSKPGMFDMVAKYKWQAWTDLGSMSQEDAQKQYIETCNALIKAAGIAAAPSNAAAMSTEFVKVENADGVTTISLNRPDKRNSITFEMYQTLMKAFDDAAADPNCRVLVLTGNGSFFSAGNDLSNFTTNLPKGGIPEMASIARNILHDYVARFIHFPKPLVVALNGPAVGIAVTTLPMADLVYASHKATLHAPLAALGQTPEGCSSVTFPRLFGHARAMELLVLGRKLSADEGLQWGLVNEVFEDGEFRAKVAERVAALAAQPPVASQESKRILRAGMLKELADGNAAECDLIKKAWLGPECQAAVMKFLTAKKK